MVILPQSYLKRQYRSVVAQNWALRPSAVLYSLTIVSIDVFFSCFLSGLSRLVIPCWWELVVSPPHCYHDGRWCWSILGYSRIPRTCYSESRPKCFPNYADWQQIQHVVCQQERRRLLLTVILWRSQHGVNQHKLCHPPIRPIDPKLFCRDSLLKTIPLKDVSFFYADNDTNAQTRRVCCGVRRRRAVECTASSPTDPHPAYGW